MKSTCVLLLGMAILAVAGPATAQTMAGGSVSVHSGFGRALAISNSDLLIGEAQNQTRPGAVYIYRKQGGKWTEQTHITATGAPANDGFGSALAVSGDLMLVGASRADGNRGAAYVFQRDARGAWNQVAVLANPDTAGTGFGTTVAISGDLAVIGAAQIAKQTGAAYVFRRAATGGWTQEAKLLSPEAKEQMLFGESVAISGDRILVGEPNFNERTGTVHVFTRDGAAWKAAAKLAANGLQKNDRYGAPIALDGSRVLVGATGFAGNSGAVFAFAPDPQSDWKESGRYMAYDGRPSDQFGSAFAADGGNVWVGAPRANGFRGALYHFWRSATDSTVGGAERMSAGELGSQAFFGATVVAKGNLAAATIGNADFGLGAVAVYEFAQNNWNLSTILRGAEDRIPSIARKTECTTGKAAQFQCSDVDLVSYLSVPDMGGVRGVQLNDIWGWTDPETGKEWAIVGRFDGTSFVDVSNPEKPVYVANLPMTKGANAAAWRDMKVYKNHVYIVADGSGPHGMQVFDLTRLRSIRQPPVTLEPNTVYRKINSAHNIVLNEETGYAYSVGSSSGGETCGGGLHMISLKDPKNPEFAGCFSDGQTGRANTGYSHDAQCVVYKGPDEQYKGREICLGSNETMLSIADVTDKKSPKPISRASYPNVGYSHQGWLDEGHRYFYMNDELDELAGTTPKTRTIVWDLTDLDDPQVATMFLSPTAATDHNLYIKGDTMYQSHYVSGLRIVDISNRTAPVEVGFFDTVPYGENKPGFGGSWSNFPYFKSGIIIATSMNEGLFILKKKDPKPVL